MTQEKLEQRLAKFFAKYGKIGGNNGANPDIAIRDAVRAELQKAAEIAQKMATDEPGTWPKAATGIEIAAEIRKLMD